MIQQNEPLQISIDRQEQGIQQSEDNKLMKSENTKVDNQSFVKGLCQQFISKNQKDARQLNFFQIASSQHENWQPMACHFRNIEYNSQNVRTHKTLINCFQLIQNQYFPYYQQVFNDENERKKLQLFLYDRVRSIRCQLFVQGIFDPKLSIKILRLILFLQTLIGQPINLSPLYQFLKRDNKQLLLSNQESKKYYYQVLQYAIYWQKKQRLSELLDNHFAQIEENQRLKQCLSIKLKIINKNYYVYLSELLKNKNIYTRLIFWSQIKDMRQIILSHYKKAKMNERASFLCRIMGYPKIDGWVNISKAQDYQKLQKCKVNYDLQIKLWIKQSDLLTALANKD